MIHYDRPEDLAEFKKNFKQKKPLMNETEAYYEGSRCLFCYDAPCITACPTGIDIPLFIKQIHTGNEIGAARTIYESNWLGNACGKVCPTGELCEGACVYNHQDVAPIQIGRLQNYATAAAIKNGSELFQKSDKNGKKVAIIGAGPAGISCACELSLKGYDVVIFESKEKASGLTVYGIAPYKIENEEVLDEIKYLQKEFGFDIKYNEVIEHKSQIEILEKEYDAIFIGIGSGPTRKLKIQGEEKEGVIGAVEWIEQLRMKQHELKVPDRVVVIGGGNTAMDAASESARMGANFVLLAYRRAKEDMGAYHFEYETAVAAGVSTAFGLQPEEIIGDDDKVTGIKFLKTKYEDDKLVTIPDSDFVFNCDLVIKATGQAKLQNLLKDVIGVETDDRDRIVVNTKSFQTSKEKYFAGGDAVNGGAEVVNACYEGKQAALGIHNWLFAN